MDTSTNSVDTSDKAYIEETLILTDKYLHIPSMSYISVLGLHLPSMFETWWMTTSFVFLESISFNWAVSGTSSGVKFTNFNMAPVFWATICQGTIALWCSAMVTIICKRFSESVSAKIQELDKIVDLTKLYNKRQFFYSVGRLGTYQEARFIAWLNRQNNFKMNSQWSFPVHRFYDIGFRCSQIKVKSDIQLSIQNKPSPDCKESKMLRLLREMKA